MGRIGPTMLAMNRSVLLRLLPTSRTGARLAGTAEVVETGERRSFRDADDLLLLLQRLHAAPAETPEHVVPPIDVAAPPAHPPRRWSP